MIKNLLLFSVCVLSVFSTEAANTQKIYLSGTDKDNTVMWDFMCTAGRNSGKWSRIAVPSCWETQGFGNYYYGRDKNEPNGENGNYKTTFKADKSWSGKRVNIVFEGSMTDTYVKVNGKSVGDVHQGSFYRFSYDITPFLKYGAKNTLEVEVHKRSSNKSVNRAERDADFWIFGGIYRPVYLEVMPETHLASMAIDARADGSLTVRPFIEGAKKDYTISLQLEELDGRKVELTGASQLSTLSDFNVIVPNATLWNHEKPYLYKLKLLLSYDGVVKHQLEHKIGFRTIELRYNDGFYLNGERVIFKGANRHCFWPETGRTLSRELSIKDAQLMKEMNMNAVRCAHYPPDVDFIEVCDSLGLLVINELCGWQAAYDTPTARKLVKEMVERDRNFASIVIWANGNEGGWNTNVDNDYDMYDIQKRIVIHPWLPFRGTDTRHYPTFNCITNSMLYNHDVRFPTEFMHGLYDGGAAAGLQEFWNTMMQHRAPAGGFIWALVDEGIVRDDKDGFIDVSGDQAPDGIVGPYREKEASFEAIRKIWSPIMINNKVIPEKFDGRLSIENNYMFTDLFECKISYKLGVVEFDGNSISVRYTDPMSVIAPSLAPDEKRFIKLTAPKQWNKYDILNVKITDPTGHDLYTWSWPIGRSPKLTTKMLESQKAGRNNDIEISSDDTILSISTGKETYMFDRKTGYLSSVETSNGKYPISGGPVVLNQEDTPIKELRHYTIGDTVVVEPVFDGKQKMLWKFVKGSPARLDYSFLQPGEIDYIGIGMNYPESSVKSFEWIGNGPSHVWRNRLQGVEFDYWKKDYNKVATGESWGYPEFKGYHADIRVAKINSAEGSFMIIPADPGQFIQLFSAEVASTKNKNTAPEFPKTNIGVLSAIPPIGAKFNPSSQMGVTGQKNTALSSRSQIKGSFWLIFE